MIEQLLPRAEPRPRHVRLVPAPARPPADAHERLGELFHEAVATPNPDAVLDRLVAALADVVPYDTLTILEADEALRLLRPVVARDGHGRRVVADAVGFGVGVTGWVAEHREPVRAQPAHLDRRARVAASGYEEPAALVSIPLVAGGSLNGVLDVRRVGAVERFAGEEFELVKRFGDVAALALANSRARATLEHTFLSTVAALANALEASDEYTSSHARHIAELALPVGARLALDSDALRRLELGALFHDIGKIGIPSSILSKPAALTPEERAVVEQHPELGERIIAPIERLDDVCRIVRHCHEHYDGGGYPDAKAGAAIPIESRIILVCDAYDAMTTDRPYRRRLPNDEAIRRLRASAGAQFDPDVVDAFVSLFATHAVRDSRVA